MRLPLVLFRPHRAASVTRVWRYRDAAPCPHLVRPTARPRDDRAAYKWWVGGIVILTTIIVVMSFEALSLALPTMMISMRVGLQEISWTLTGYMISRTLFVGTAGWLGNRLGNRNLFAMSLAVFTAGALLCGLAWRFEALVLFRIVQGMGGGPLVPLIMVILHETFPPEQRGLAQSLDMVGDATGSVLGRGLAGYLIDALGWRSVFYLTVPLGLVSLVGLLLIVPNRREPQTQTFDPLILWAWWCSLRSLPVSWWGSRAAPMMAGPMRVSAPCCCWPGSPWWPLSPSKPWCRRHSSISSSFVIALIV